MEQSNVLDSTAVLPQHQKLGRSYVKAATKTKLKEGSGWSPGEDINSAVQSTTFVSGRNLNQTQNISGKFAYGVRSGRVLEKVEAPFATLDTRHGRKQTIDT